MVDIKILFQKECITLVTSERINVAIESIDGSVQKFCVGQGDSLTVAGDKK
jgi:hypothetical protein